MPNYENSKIYKLVSPHTDEIYIGSTTQKLCNRMGQHLRDFKIGKNKCTCVKLLELGEVKIILIEECPCDTKEQLLKRERYYIENTVCVNKYIPGRTIKEYYEDNKERLLKIQKVHYETNKEKITQYRKEYLEKNKEKISQQRKGFYEENKEKILKQKKEYYHENKEKILEKKKEKLNCECGSTFIRCSKARHERTKKHQNYLLQN